ncbi:MAG: AMP-binding protein [Congregibacter sp.]|nr:AMP-binding protein [Congregibacter sp.]
MYSVTEFLKSNVRATPTAHATRHLGRSHSWAKMQDRVSRLASALRVLDVQAGDRVAMLALNSDRYLEYYFAVWWAGAVVVPMNTRWSAAESVYALGDADAKVLFVDDAFAPMLDAITAELSLRHVVFTGEAQVPEGALDYETLIASHDPCEDAERGGDDLAGLYYTGGTTGFPKGVMLSQQALWFNNLSVSSGSSYRLGDVYLHAGPMFHLADGAFSGAACTAGLCHTFLPTFDPSKVMDLLESQKVTHTLMVPTMLGMLVNHPDFDPERLRALRAVGYGASPMPEGLMHSLLERLPWVGWMQGYGQTEMAPIISLLAAENHTLEGPQAGKLRSAGKAGPGVEVRICDEAGNDLPNGEVGEIVARPLTCRGRANCRAGWL